MKIDFLPDISSVKNDLEQVMNEVTNFQENCNQLSYDPDLIFETRDQKKFVKNESIRSELHKVELNVKNEVDNVSKKFVK